MGWAGASAPARQSVLQTFARWSFWPLPVALHSSTIRCTWWCSWASVTIWTISCGVQYWGSLLVLLIWCVTTSWHLSPRRCFLKYSPNISIIFTPSLESWSELRVCPIRSFTCYAGASITKCIYCGTLLRESRVQLLAHLLFSSYGRCLYLHWRNTFLLRSERVLTI